MRPVGQPSHFMGQETEAWARGGEESEVGLEVDGKARAGCRRLEGPGLGLSVLPHSGPHEKGWSLPPPPTGRSWTHGAQSVPHEEEQRCPLPSRTFGVWETRFPAPPSPFPSARVTPTTPSPTADPAQGCSREALPKQGRRGLQK